MRIRNSIFFQFLEIVTQMGQVCNESVDISDVLTVVGLICSNLCSINFDVWSVKLNKTDWFIKSDDSAQRFTQRCLFTYIWLVSYHHALNSKLGNIFVIIFQLNNLSGEIFPKVRWCQSWLFSQDFFCLNGKMSEKAKKVQIKKKKIKQS